jgi:hypothetical protein
MHALTLTLAIAPVSLARDTLKLMKKRAEVEQRYAKDLHALFSLSKESESHLNVVGGSIGATVRVVYGESR